MYTCITAEGINSLGLILDILGALLLMGTSKNFLEWH